MPKQSDFGTGGERAMPAIKHDQRREWIMTALERDGQVSVATLAGELCTTTVTIRSDLDAMERDGLVERVSGGAVPTTVSLFDREFLRRKRICTDEKRALAEETVKEVEDGDVLFINSGSTTYFTVLALKKVKKRLIIITNSLSIATELGTAPTYTVILVGGQINSYYSFTCGAEALNQLKQYQVDKVILSVDGVDQSGITTIHPEESAIDALMLEHARRRIVIADSTKIGKIGYFTICKPDQIDLLITGSSADKKALEQLRGTGLDIRCIP